MVCGSGSQETGTRWCDTTVANHRDARRHHSSRCRRTRQRVGRSPHRPSSSSWRWATRGRKKDASIKDALEVQVKDETGGDPMSAKKWVRGSLRKMKQALGKQGYRICQMTVRRLLKDLEYSLQANSKRFTGPSHPDRDHQFRYIARVKKLFFAAGCPVISTDTKKKELIGNFKNAGRTWCNRPEVVNAHDFPIGLWTNLIGCSESRFFGSEVLVKY